MKPFFIKLWEIIAESFELIKLQISSIKLQINPKFQASITKTCLEFQTCPTDGRRVWVIYGFGILNFGHCNLFDICDLLFVILGKEIPILLNYSEDGSFSAIGVSS